MNTVKRTYPAEQADNLMCVPACLNMILQRRGLQPFSQESIAGELGLIVPPELHGAFPSAGISADNRDWGVHPQNEATSLTAFLSRHRIQLCEAFYSPQQIPSSFGYGEFLLSAIEAGNDVIVGYDYAAVFGVGRHVGHVSLVCDVDSTGTRVCLLDPEFVDRGPQWLGLDQLLTGIRAQGDGFWLIGTADALRQCSELLC